MVIEDFLARQLREAGVRRFFGVPGGPSIPYLEAFRKAGIEFILASHEASAAVMADVTARLTGVTGVCHATFGPGAVNLASGVGGALLDRSPLIALTTEMSEAWLGRTSQMNIDHQVLFRPLTKETFRLNADNAREIISRALELANEEYPGPVHMGLPSDLAGSVAGPYTGASGSAGTPGIDSIAGVSGAGVETPWHASAGGGSGSGAGISRHTSVPGASGARVRISGHASTGEDNRARAGDLIASSRRPLIAVGLTAMRTVAGRSLVRFLEEHKVPVVVTPMAKGVITHDHQSFAGVLFHALSDRLAGLIRAADLVIGLGYDPVEYNYESWLPEVPLVHFDTKPSDLRISGAIEVVSAPEEWFRVLSPLGSSDEMMALAARTRDEIRTSLKRAGSGLNPVTALSLLRELLPSDTTVTADVGSHLHLAGQMWDLQRGKLIMTNGWSSMGFGLPAAVAAALAGGGEPVVCVTGDGGFAMSAGEIMTARRLGLKIIVVVFSDGELNLIKVKQSWKSLSPYGIHVHDGSLFGADRFLGVDVQYVTDLSGMRSALKRALASGGCEIIEAAINPSVYDDLIVKS